ncbi:2Fe-2S iron-sulfur cluster-binding protein [Ideonella sp.]|uniref:2Fe-2S iron-sulfur cluster-binding protein n=1 Tax=Ideonella sp. TaxID=1929293 RepID=UPI002B46796F|nr:2Fe-2S iron-sulfur cluster-binding protein [Ideonella sp.]HJV69067.1 2Fe-2S iron-sulfur cluster-binding protein [Ideonella sp.]
MPSFNLPPTSASQLLAWILLALLLQVALGAGLALWRRRPAAAGPAQPAFMAAPPAPSTGAWPGTRAFRVASRQYEDAAGTQCSFYLEPVDGAPLPEFKPGQFLTFALPMPDASAPGGQRTVTRCYSLSDRPLPTHYRITVKRVPAPPGEPAWPPGVASHHLHDQVHAGDVLQVRAPGGRFFIDPDPAVPVVLVAGGIGITPMMSMLGWCLATQPGRPVHLYYGVRHGGEQAFKTALAQLAADHPQLTLNVAYSRPRPEDRQGVDYQHAGHVDVALLRGTLPHGRHQFYVCGPAAMMDTLVPGLAEWGVPAADIDHEAFGPAAVRRPTAQPAAPTVAAALQVRFERSGRTLDWDAQAGNLLDFAERHGIEVESGCRSGGCGSCETRLLSGSVSYAEPPDHDIAPGHCLLCVGRPQSALVLEA